MFLFGPINFYQTDMEWGQVKQVAASEEPREKRVVLKGCTGKIRNAAGNPKFKFCEFFPDKSRSLAETFEGVTFDNNPALCAACACATNSVCEFDFVYELVWYIDRTSGGESSQMPMIDPNSIKFRKLK